jgi:uncharacterized short protein YbdD (DUF466 family)
MKTLIGKSWDTEELMVKEIENDFYDVLYLSEYEDYIEVMNRTNSDDEVETYYISRKNNQITITGR